MSSLKICGILFPTYTCKIKNKKDFCTYVAKLSMKSGIDKNFILCLVKENMNFLMDHQENVFNCDYGFAYNKYRSSDFS